MLVLVLCVGLIGQAKPSALAPAKEWWKALKPGDAIRLHVPRDAGIPLVELWKGDADCLIFDDAIAREDFESVKALYAEHRLFWAWNRHWVKIVAIHDTWPPGPKGVKLKTPIAEVMTDLNGYPLKDPDTAGLGMRLALPIAYLGAPNQTVHPDRDRMPLLVRGMGSKRGTDCIPFGKARWRK